MKRTDPPKAVYEITEHFFGKPSPQAVQVSFSLDARDWCTLQQSEAWSHLLEALAYFQKGQGRSGRLTQKL